MTTYVTVTGQMEAPSNDPIVGGKMCFVPDSTAVFTDTGVQVRRRYEFDIAEDGTFTAEIPATDSGNPVGWTYAVTEAFRGGRTYHISAPAAGMPDGGWDITQLAPVATNEGVASYVGPTGPQGETGPQGATGPQGDIGPIGLTGTNGTNGVDGKTVRNGSGAPNNSLGVDGDFYIDTTAEVIYGPKASGAWPGSGTNLVGPAGSPTTFELRGTGNPNGSTTASVGTYFTDTAATNGAVRWFKATGTGNTGWVCVYGDTGWRDVSTLLLNGWAGSAGAVGVKVRRVNGETWFCYRSLNGASATSTTVITFAMAGFAPAAANGGVGNFGSGVQAISCNTAKTVTTAVTASTGGSGYVTWPAEDGTWPATLPGTATT